MPACSTASSATSGTSATGWSSSVTFSEPTCWYLVNGATSGSGRATWVLILLAVPAGTATTMASGRPSFTSWTCPSRPRAWRPAGRRRTADGVVGRVAPVQQLLRFVGAHGLAGGAQHDRQQAAAAGQVGEVALGGGDHAVAGGFGMAGLQAVDGRVAEQQQVAVGVVGRRRARVAVLLDGVVLGSPGSRAPAGSPGCSGRAPWWCGRAPSGLRGSCSWCSSCPAPWPGRSSARRSARPCRPRLRPAPPWRRCPTARSFP
jgi:hypothetical protein